MTNNEIIIRTAVMLGIFDPEFIEKCLCSGCSLPFHTYKVWQDLGYQVKKGEKGTQIIIWNARKKKVSGSDEIPEEEEQRSHDGFYQHKAYFFRLDQVEKKEKEVV